jgi:hypothetical protein
MSTASTVLSWVLAVGPQATTPYDTSVSDIDVDVADGHYLSAAVVADGLARHRRVLSPRGCGGRRWGWKRSGSDLGLRERDFGRFGVGGSLSVGVATRRVVTRQGEEQGS